MVTLLYTSRLHMEIFIVEEWDDTFNQETILHVASSEERALSYIRSFTSRGDWVPSDKALWDREKLYINLRSYPLDNVERGKRHAKRKTINLEGFV